MTNTEDRPTLEERYTRAMSARHLEVKDRPGDVDVLIAAGWCRESLGTMLYRLLAEFDTVKGEHALAYAEVARIDRLIAKGRDDYQAARHPKQFLRDEILLLEAEAKHTAVTSRIMILATLKSLAPTKQALTRWAVVQATKLAFMKDDASVCRLAAKVLDAFLDPLCGHCRGRCFHGGYGTPQLTCRACAGTGKRRTLLGADGEERQFAGRLLADMDGMLATVNRQMRAFLRADGPKG